MKIYKKAICIGLAGVMVLAFSACGKKNSDNNGTMSGGSNTVAVMYKDGEYKASESKFDDQGYKPTVKVVVKDGKLYSVDCDDEYQDDGTKKAHSESGKYNMKAGGAQYDWHEEIALFERYVVENGLENIQLDGNGKTDTITGCTIAVDHYVKLIKEALKKAEK